ncbi:hypothetical protein BST25_20300 [Mycobacterium heidelbergense]|uniref:Uncharacterized protein n=2 Tax=Mycobacterium heidelbergense TaxID=53376 RepID=A0A1X0DC64_MYCHE|nr:hypothetical protein BST25_20300 [Mycobacterium heidelbergense]BBZ52171.1 hypothetical protein MHEI_38880 [Mycobacterium heidelbergense]
MSVGWRAWDEGDAADEVLGATGVWLIPRAPTMLEESRCRVVTTDTGRDAQAGAVLSREHQEVLEWAQARVDELIGVVEAKERFAQWRSTLQTSQHSGAVPTCGDNHMVFLGAPGTAKRTFARVVGEVLFGLGTIARPDVTEVSAEDVVVGGLSRSAVAMKSVTLAVWAPQTLASKIVVNNQVTGTIATPNILAGGSLANAFSQLASQVTTGWPTPNMWFNGLVNAYQTFLATLGAQVGLGGAAFAAPAGVVGIAPSLAANLGGIAPSIAADFSGIVPSLAADLSGLAPSLAANLAGTLAPQLGTLAAHLLTSLF